MLIRSQNCIKCLLIIAVIHSMRLSLNHIVIYHNSDSQMLKREMRYAISKILDILTEDQTILGPFSLKLLTQKRSIGKEKENETFFHNLHKLYKKYRATGKEKEGKTFLLKSTYFFHSSIVTQQVLLLFTNRVNNTNGFWINHSKVH